MVLVQYKEVQDVQRQLLFLTNNKLVILYCFQLVSATIDYQTHFNSQHSHINKALVNKTFWILYLGISISDPYE